MSIARLRYIGGTLYKSRRKPRRAPLRVRQMAWLAEQLEAMVARGELVKFASKDGKPGEFYGLPGSAP